MICARPGCTGVAIPKYCSRRCSAIDHAHQRGGAFYATISQRGMNTKRLKGHRILRASDVSLMASGRYAEAARAIYDRGYGGGWLAGRRGHRQLPCLSQSLGPKPMEKVPFDARKAASGDRDE